MDLNPLSKGREGWAREAALGSRNSVIKSCMVEESRALSRARKQLEYRVWSKEGAGKAGGANSYLTAEGFLSSLKDSGLCPRNHMKLLSNLTRGTDQGCKGCSDVPGTKWLCR